MNILDKQNTNYFIPLQIFSVCAMKLQNLHFHRYLRRCLGWWSSRHAVRTQLWADITLLCTQSSYGNTTDEVVTAKCNHHPVLLPRDRSCITLTGVLGVFKLFNHALIETLLLSHHRWLMASTVCGFTAFNPQEAP